MKTIVTIYTDGGCNTITRKGSWAFAVSKKYFWYGNETDTTNNRMELTAIIQAIKTVRERNQKIFINIYSDSKYCVDGFTSWMYNWKKKDWKKVKNPDLWKELYDIRRDVEISWVRGHSNNEMNNFVDSLCINDREMAD